MTRPIQSVLIVGSDLAAWAAAAWLKARLPGLRVRLSGEQNPKPTLVDLSCATLPSIRDFHRLLKLDEANMLACSGGTFRLGQKAQGWSGKGSSFFRPFPSGTYTLGSLPLHHGWRALPKEGVPLEAFSIGARLAEAGRFASANDLGDTLPALAFGYLLDPPLYRDYLRAYALHLGVECLPRVAECLSGERGITGVRLSTAELLEADLYIDATADGILIRSLEAGAAWEDWGSWLPGDSLIHAESPPEPLPPPCDRVLADEQGWHMEVPLRRRTLHLSLYSSAVSSDDEASSRLAQRTGVSASAPPLRLRQGRRARSWIGNCVAIGDAASMLEPLDCAAFQLVEIQLRHIVDLLPDLDFAAVELDEYERRVRLRIESLRNFQIARYQLSSLHGAFWERPREAPPEELARAIALFGMHGKIPFAEGELFELEEWAHLLVGLGVRPTYVDRLPDEIPDSELHRHAAERLDLISRLVGRAPSHRDALMRAMVRRSAGASA